VNDLIIRPTAKFILVRLILAGIVFLALEIVYFVYWRANDKLHWVPLVAPIVFIPPALRAMRRQMTTTTISGDRLRFESGFMSKSTRTIQLSKLQDVRVDQDLLQRLFRVGNLSIETAGEASRLTLPDVDNPQSWADEILNRSQRGTI
jgi:uncharacterized membrane protein YdbT with pleckstrin-like domain